MASWSRFSGFNNVSTVPAGSFAKASLVGAKTVNGPLLANVSVSFAAFMAVASVLKSGDAEAAAMMLPRGEPAAEGRGNQQRGSRSRKDEPDGAHEMSSFFEGTSDLRRVVACDIRD